MTTAPNLRLASSDVTLTWAAANEEFLADLKLRNYSPHTIAWYRSVLDPFGRFLADSFSTDDPSAVTQARIKDFLRSMAEGGATGRAPIGPRRLNHYRAGLKSLYDWLCEQGYTNHNPAEGIGKLKEPRRVIPTLTGEQVVALVEQPDPATVLGRRDRCFLLLLLDTGLRLSEALGLRVADLDLEAGGTKVMGKGAKERRAGLSPGLVSEFRAYLRFREHAMQEIGCDESPWLFPNNVGGKLSPKTVQQMVKRYGVAAGIDPEKVRISPHTLRHTYAITYFRNGGDPFTLQKILGHSNLETSRRYCELADEDVLRRQRELSPVASLGLTSGGRRRIKRKPQPRRRLNGSDPARASGPLSPTD